MINIIPSIKLITICGNCKSGLEYELEDVQGKTEVVYNGFFHPADYVVKKHIVCPKCGNEVKLYL